MNYSIYVVLLSILLMACPVASEGKTVNVNLHYPWHKVGDYMLLFVGQGQYSTLEAFNNMVIKSSVQDVWSTTLTNVMANDGDTVQFSVIGLDYRGNYYDATAPYTFATNIQQSHKKCLKNINHDLEAGLFVSYANHNTTLHFNQDSNETTIELYPYFCGDDFEKIGTFEISSELFEQRTVTVTIPTSLLENDIKRPVNILYILDGSPYNSKTLASTIHTELYKTGKEYAIVWLPAYFRGHEYVPFVNLSNFDLSVLCSGTCSDTSGIGNGKFLPDFIRNTVEPIALNILSDYVSSVDKRGLMGYSLGGLETLYIAVKHTNLFDYYLAGSPSTWVNIENIISNWLPSEQSFPEGHRLYVSNCLPQEGFDPMMVSTADAVMSYVGAIWNNLVLGENYWRQFYMPTIHSTHCMRKLFDDFPKFFA